MPNGLIHEDSLRAHPKGLALTLTLPWYRSLWLSSVSTLKLTLDGEEVPQQDLSFQLGGTIYALEELPAQAETLWFLQEHLHHEQSGEFEPVFARYNIACAFLPPESPTAQRVVQKGWRVTARDADWLVLQAPKP